MPNFKIVVKYPCADCGDKFRERDLGWCDHEDNEYYCPTCWETDDTHTLPPPPLDMIEEAEKENDKYIHELFAKCQTIPAFNKYVDPVLSKKFAHPVAKIMDKLIGEYWGQSSIKANLKDIENNYQKLLDGTLNTRWISAEYVKRMYEGRHNWSISTILGKKYYYYDDPVMFTPSDLCRKTQKGRLAQIKKIEYQVTCAKTGKAMKSREETFQYIWGNLTQWSRLSVDGIYVPLNVLERIMRKNRFNQDKTEEEAERWHYQARGIKEQRRGVAYGNDFSM